MTELDGVRSPYLEQPDRPSETILRVDRPGPKPQNPVGSAAYVTGDVELTPRERDLLQQYKRDLAAWQKHTDLYDNLFGARTPPEALELVFAVGLLNGSTDQGAFKRHLVTTPAAVQLDRQTQRLRVVLVDSTRLELNWTDGPVRTALGDAERPLRDLHDAQTLAGAVTAADEARASFGLAATKLQNHGEALPPGKISLQAFPALLLRKRDSSFLLKLLRDMTEDMENGGFVSEPFNMIVSETHVADDVAVREARAALPLPANTEQQLMIDGARRERHMVVQGPPGTGKTHTIANLAAVLMAEGRRVLITAETEKALQEVQAKLPSDMQSLLLPMLKQTGTAPLQAAVNELTSRAGKRSTEETRAKAEAAAVAKLEQLETATAAAERRLIQVADSDREPRTFQGTTLPVSGHLIALDKDREALALVDDFLGKSGHVTQRAATKLLELTPVVTDAHRRLAETRLPEGLMEPPEFGVWLQEHRSALSVLGDRSDYDYSSLADSVADLEKLAGMLHALPPTPWASITHTSDEYAAALEAVEGAAADLDHSVVVDPNSATPAAIALLEEYLALDETRFDEPIPQLVEQQQRAREQSANVPTSGDFGHYSRSTELTSACERSIELLTRDRSGLLARHVSDHRTQGYSPVDTLIGEAAALLPGSRDPVGLEVIIADGSPAFHDLEGQAKALREHLATGGKMKGLMRTPKPVRDAEQLIQYVTIAGSQIDTLEEAERAVEYLGFRKNIGMIDAWAEKNQLMRPAGVSHHEWLTAVVGIPARSEEIRATYKLAEELVSFPLGTAPEQPHRYLRTVLATVSKELADSLEGLAHLHEEAPPLLMGGRPVQNRTEGTGALAALRAAQLRTSIHGMLPEPWQESCNPVDVDEADVLGNMLRVCIAAAKVPGKARSANLTPSAVHGIAEKSQVDRRRSELRAEHDTVLGGMQRLLAASVPQSPATQAVGSALEREDPIAYRIAVDELAVEREMAQQASTLSAVRDSVFRAHRRLLTAFDAGDTRAVEVLRDIDRFERLRDHRAAVRRWQSEIGSTADIHDELASLYQSIRRAEHDLSSLRCWDRAVARLQERRELKSALSALTNAVDAVPKTKTAKSYPARMRALQDATRNAAPAIPCWVMTIDRAAEVLGYPTGEDRFDVVIVDEASQAWFPAMFLYAIADQVIIVGDKMQTSPAAVRGIERLESITREHIFGHRLENRVGSDLSLYDVAEVMTGPEMLVDHFRCVPDIIDISNRLSYEPMGRSLLPSRVREPGALDPVVHVRVDGRRHQSSWANEQEVDAIVERVVQCHADPAYAGMDFGVVVVGPQPTAHVRQLRSKLLDRLGGTAMRERNLEVGTAAEFQGAERNVMFLSLVVAAELGEKITIWPHEHSGRNRRRVQELNVAVSRARDQLWIFHSFEPSQLRPNDARTVVLEAPARVQLDLDEQLERCDSQFERDVVTALAEADPTLILRTQVEAIGYSIDIVVEDRDGHRLAVECDGDLWHSSETQIRNDLYRQRTLETIGWRFNRFLASEWYADPATYVAQILKDLRRSDRPAPLRAVPIVEEYDDANEDGQVDESEDETATDDPDNADQSDELSKDDSTSRTETVTCLECRKKWDRPIMQGVKPIKCPSCRKG